MNAVETVETPRAASPLAAATAETTEMLVCFFLGKQEYALPISQVREVVLPVKSTPVVYTPPFVLGIINLRGEIVAILDISLFFGLQAISVTDKSRIIIVEANGVTAGLMVDAVAKVKEIRPEAIASAPPTLDSIKAGFIRGVVQLDEHPLILLALESILAAEEMQSLRGEETKN